MTELVDAPQATKAINHWIGGKRREGGSGRTGPVYDPATGVQTGSVDFASAEEVDHAVQAARAAFPDWRALSLARRAELFFRIRELFNEHREDLARLLTAEHGKVLSDAMGEVARGLEVIEFCCGVPTLLKGGFSEQASTGIDVYSIRQPLGVVAGITPFNFPAMVPMWMWAPALACGNTFVLKPSEKDPSASALTAELLAEAGVPAGVFNVVHGDKVAVDALLAHPEVSAISFVGSTPIARSVYQAATAAGKRCQALGGAKNHMIVLPDADIEMAADAAVSAGYGSAGERCMAVSMVVAVAGVADELVEAIKRRIPKVKVGHGLDPASEMGPLVTREHRDRVASYVERAPRRGRHGRRRRPRVARPPARVLPRPVADRPRRPGDGQLPRRDLRPGPRGHPRRHLRRGGPADQREPVRQRNGHLHPRRRRRAAVPVRRPGRDGRDQRPDPGARRLLLVRRLEGLASSATATSTVPRGSTSTRARRSSPRAGPTRPPRGSTSASRRHAELTRTVARS